MGSTRKCCSVPHGQPSLWTATLATFAFILGDAAMGTCRYLIRSREDGGTRGLGLFAFEDYDEISGYYLCYTANLSTQGIDTAWTTARVFAALAVTFGLICVILVWCAMCMTFSEKIWKLIGVGYVLAAISILSTMSFFGSKACESGCKFSAGAAMALISGILDIVCAYLCCKMPQAEPEEETLPISGGAAPGTVTTTETVQPDGTRIIEKITVNTDGSRTVEKTVYEASAANEQEEAAIAGSATKA